MPCPAKIQPLLAVSFFTVAALKELAIASSIWEKYDHGYWLKRYL
jgi:hypothetical protein